ncbi:hypothetical protein FKW77_006955 [Venturia effusa]|uniref:Uncharacterized protein n=1 Tax=Venturia effusa TaxID=50376 RepID=A0A517LE33_9PEZI|nr:hypothetical protein FKW77_006955 [Venturia effusa]
MDPRTWRDMRRRGERQPGDGQRLRGPTDPRFHQAMQEREMRERMERMDLSQRRNRNGYEGGGPHNRGDYRMTSYQDGLMREQQRLERRMAPEGSYGNDRAPGPGGMVSPLERRFMDPRDRNRIREDRIRVESRMGGPRRGNFGPGFQQVELDPMYHRGGMGPAGPRLSAGGPHGMHPRQNDRPRNPYEGRYDGGMEPTFFDPRMMGPRWNRH